MIPHERAMERRQFLKGTLGAASLVALACCENPVAEQLVPFDLKPRRRS